jgi:hypothetical protein
MTPDPDDPIARMRAEMDQAREGAREFAGGLWTFFKALNEEGFKRHEALTLTVAFLQSTFANNSSSPEGGDGE